MRWHYQQANTTKRTKVKVHIHREPQDLMADVTTVVDQGIRKRSVESG